MHCPSCGALSEKADCCTGLDLETSQSSFEAKDPIREPNMNPAVEAPIPTSVKKSTLIEFPGVNRASVPEWRKELSERVREVQERRARETAREADKIEPTNAPPQLELLPPADLPVINPLVAAALKRIERAHQTSTNDSRSIRNVVAAAVAYAPACEENEPEVQQQVLTPQLAFEPELDTQSDFETEAPPQVEKSHNLIVVPPPEELQTEAERLEARRAPKRLIVDDPNDPALNYLDSISRTVRVDEIDSRRPAAFRRFVSAMFDLIICSALCMPIAFAMRTTGTALQDPAAIVVLAGCVVVVTFIYLTLSVALTGRTLAMRLFGLRVIDKKTGLIPTGSQAIGRSFLYIVSLAFAGLGIMVALVSREGYTTHDRMTRTAVIKA